uniref:Lipocalin/cytosolic fatty-acid binding domain-containing protein n=1 Tax=Amblyomma maculatum TaxID=34609 RepID=G3MSK1_AMBMU
MTASYVIKNFETPVLILASSDDAELECLSARLTHFNEAARTATYVWNIKGHKGSQKRIRSFDLRQGKELNQVDFKEKDGPSGTVTVPYSDMKNCFIGTFPTVLYGGQCMMWVRKEVEDNVPQNCIDEFEDICDVEVSEYNHDLCQDNDDEHEESRQGAP